MNTWGRDLSLYIDAKHYVFYTICFSASCLCLGPCGDLGVVQTRFSLFLLLCFPAAALPLLLSHQVMKMLWQSTLNILLFLGFLLIGKSCTVKRCRDVCVMNGKIQTGMLGRAEKIPSCACKMEVKGGE